MRRKVAGMIEPYTLGFLLSFIGAGLAFLGHAQDEPRQAESAAVAASARSGQAAGEGGQS